MAYVHATGASKSSGATLAVNKPTGTLDGHRLLLACFHQVASPITNWGVFSPLGSIDIGVTGSILEFATKIASSEASTFTVTVAGIVNLLCSAHSGRTLDSLAPNVNYTETANAVADASPVAVNVNGITPEEGDDLVEIVGQGSGNNAGPWSVTSVPPNFTDRVITQVDFSIGYLWTRDNVPEGPTGRLDAITTMGGADQGQYAAVVFALKAAAAMPKGVSKQDQAQLEGLAGNFQSELAINGWFRRRSGLLVPA